MAGRRVDAELLANHHLDGSSVSSAALARLEQLLGRALARMPVKASRFEHDDGDLSCLLERTPRHSTAVSSPEGTLTLFDLRITLGRAASARPETAAVGTPGRVDTATPPVALR